MYFFGKTFMKTTLIAVTLRTNAILSLYLLYGAAFMYFSFPVLGDEIYKLFLLFGFLGIAASPQSQWRTLALSLILASLLIQVGSWGFSLAHHPEFAEAGPDFKRLTSLLVFIPVAWTLSVNEKKPWLLLLLFFTGLYIMPFTVGNGVNEFLGTRSDFGLRNAQHPAMVFAIALLALVIFSKRIFLMLPLSTLATLAFYVAALLFCVAVLVVANTRGVFVGLLVAFLFSIMFAFKHRIYRVKRSLGVAFVIAGLVGVPLALNSEQMIERWSYEASDIQGVLHGDLGGISNRSSAGIRIHSWVEGWEWFLNSPVLGWGANGKNLVISQSDALPEDIRGDFGHLHNSFIEILVNNGLVGFSFLLFTYWWLSRTVFFGSWRVYDLDIKLFSLASLTVWIIANCFESFMFYKSGIMVFGITAGALMSLGMAKKEAAFEKKATHLNHDENGLESGHLNIEHRR